MTDKLEDKNSQQLRIQKQYKKWKAGDSKKKHISTYYPGMDRLTNFKQNYSIRSGDILMSKNFQRAYGLIVPIIFLAVLGVVLYFFIGLPVNALYYFIWCDTDCTDLPASPGIIIVAILDSLVLLLMIINMMFKEPWKSQILVKTKEGNYDFRFRKGTKMVERMESYKNKILTNMFLKADTNKDGFIDFTEFLRIDGEEHLTDEEIKEYEEGFKEIDKDGDGKLTLDELKENQP